MVDPVQLRLFDVLVQLGRQGLRRLDVVTERLLDDDTRRLGETGLGESLDDPPEQERRDLEIEDRMLGAADRLTHALVGGGIPEVALHIRQSAGEPLEHVLVQHFAGGDDRVAGALHQCSSVQSSTETPTIGQSSSPLSSSR